MNCRRDMSSQEGIELEIKRICDSNEELRDLETQLKVAYMNKERAAQLQEAMAQQIFEGKLEHAISEIMKKDRLAAAHSEIEREERMHEQRRTQKKEMQQQIAEKEMLSKELKVSLLKKEKEMINAILGSIQNEQEKETEEAHRKQHETKILIRQYQDDQKAIAQRMAAEQSLEEAKIKAYEEMVNNRAQREDERQSAKESERLKRYSNVANTTRHKEDERAQCEALCNMLWQEELQERIEREDQQRVRDQLLLKEDMRRENQKQISMRRELRAKVKEEEHCSSQSVLQLLAEREQEEETKTKLRHQAKMNYALEVEKHKVDRSKLYAESQLQFEQGKEEQNDTFATRVVAEARKKLISEHADLLRGFLVL